MCNPAEHYHITVPPRYEDLDEEDFQPFPPPMSPVATRLPRQQTRTSRSPVDNLQSEGGELKVGGLLLTHMEEEPMVKQMKQPTATDVEKLLSEKALSALGIIFQNIHVKGEGHEEDDLHTLLDAIQNWATSFYPDKPSEDLLTQLAEIGDSTVFQSCLDQLQHRVKTTVSALPECTDCKDTDRLSDSSFTGERELLISRRTVLQDQEMLVEDSGILTMLHEKHNTIETAESLFEQSP